MTTLIKQSLRKAWDFVTHVLGSLLGRYYFEDYIRVYPDGIVLNRLGRRRDASQFDLNNYRNHRKFYAFARQFVVDRVVVDVGCGSGYGSALLKQAGARQVFAADISTSAVDFAKERYGELVTFSVQPMTNMRSYRDGEFDVTISSEVLEHIKEYGKEDGALAEIKRITRPHGIVIIGTPNSELLGDHGFYYEEIDALMRRHFSAYCIFENALVPFGQLRQLWERRLAQGQIGVVVTQNIDLSETALPEGAQPELKTGIEPGTYEFFDLVIDTTALHNTHSWIVVAKND